MAIRIVLVVAVLLPYCTLALPEGPPVSRHPEICRSMSPGDHHPSPTATGPAPYTIQVSNTSYTMGTPIKVTVSANQGITFSGFFVQARRMSGTTSQTDEALGDFSNIPQGSQLLNCTSVAGAWGHNSKADKTMMQATWMPPSDNAGPIEFQATIVRGPASLYWEGVKSQSLSYSAAPGGSSSLCVTLTAVCLALKMMART